MTALTQLFNQGRELKNIQLIKNTYLENQAECTPATYSSLLIDVLSSLRLHFDESKMNRDESTLTFTQDVLSFFVGQGIDIEVIESEKLSTFCSKKILDTIYENACIEAILIGNFEIVSRLLASKQIVLTPQQVSDYCKRTNCSITKEMTEAIHRCVKMLNVRHFLLDSDAIEISNIFFERVKLPTISYDKVSKSQSISATPVSTPELPKKKNRQEAFFEREQIRELEDSTSFRI